MGCGTLTVGVDHMNLNYLQYFRVLAQTEHYTHAAELLDITQPSLSHAISSLEDELGIYLFEKQGRNVRLSKYGKLFYEYIDQGLHLIEEGERKLKQATSADHGHIDLAYIYTLGSHYVPDLLSRFLSLPRHSHIEFSLKQGSTVNLIQGLKEEQYDIAFCSYVAQEESNIHFLPIAQEELVLIVSNKHPLATRDTIDLKEVKDLPFVYFDKTSGIRPLIDDLFDQIHCKPNILCEVEEDHAVIGLVAVDYGIALVPHIPAIKHYPVKALTIINPPHKRFIYLATMKNRYQTPAVREFCNFVIHNTSLPIQ